MHTTIERPIYVYKQSRRSDDIKDFNILSDPISPLDDHDVPQSAPPVPKSFFNFADTPPCTPSRPKKFFNTLRHRAQSQSRPESSNGRPRSRSTGEEVVMKLHNLFGTLGGGMTAISRKGTTRLKVTKDLVALDGEKKDESLRWKEFPDNGTVSGTFCVVSRETKPRPSLAGIFTPTTPEPNLIAFSPQHAPPSSNRSSISSFASSISTTSSDTDSRDYEPTFISGHEHPACGRVEFNDVEDTSAISDLSVWWKGARKY